MRNFQKAGVALLAGLAGLAGAGSTLAQNNPPGAAPQNEQPGQPGIEERQPEAQPQAPASSDTYGKQKGMGANASASGFVLGPLDTSGVSSPSGYGAGVGPSGEVNPSVNASAPAPVPQYWLADASLFMANAGNAAQTLANEQALAVQAPNVLGNQAQFLLAATDRAISSLAALEANAAATRPRAVAEIRTAMNELTAAKGQAQQALDAANAGVFGPSHHATIRSAYEHLQAAERSIGTVGREYGAPGYTLASSCSFRGRGLGVGIGGKPGAAPAKSAPDKAAPDKNAPAPDNVAPPEKSPPPQP